MVLPDHATIIENRLAASRQIREILNHESTLPEVTCICAAKIALDQAYKCAECGRWWCPRCALPHFGLEVVAGHVVPK